MQQRKRNPLFAVATASVLVACCLLAGCSGGGGGGGGGEQQSTWDTMSWDLDNWE